MNYALDNISKLQLWIFKNIYTSKKWYNYSENDSFYS